MFQLRNLVLPFFAAANSHIFLRSRFGFAGNDHLLSSSAQCVLTQWQP